MNDTRLKAAIIKVAAATNTTKELVTFRLQKGDAWTWYLIKQAA